MRRWYAQHILSRHPPGRRPMLTYATPHVAVQVRTELTRVHLAMADMAGARTLMREIGELLRRRPGLGTLVGEASALRVQLAKEHGSGQPRASALTAAELHLLPLLCTHMSFPEIAVDVFLSTNTIQVASSLDVPQARSYLTKPGGHPEPGS